MTRRCIWHPSAYAREDVTLGGVTIARSEMVHPLLGSANRDERQFVRPDDLDIAREPNRHVAFGQGVHYCLGAALRGWRGRSPSTPSCAGCRSCASPCRGTPSAGAPAWGCTAWRRCRWRFPARRAPVLQAVG